MTAPSFIPRCEDCRWFAPRYPPAGARDAGTCHAHPPVVVSESDAAPRSRWPSVTANDFCGEFTDEVPE